jgi:hypothetical protein
MEEVEQQLLAVSNEIRAVDARLSEPNVSLDTQRYLWKEKEQLRSEKNLLLKEKLILLERNLPSKLH